MTSGAQEVFQCAAHIARDRLTSGAAAVRARSLSKGRAQDPERATPRVRRLHIPAGGAVASARAVTWMPRHAHLSTTDNLSTKRAAGKRSAPITKIVSGDYGGLDAAAAGALDNAMLRRPGAQGAREQGMQEFGSHTLPAVQPPVDCAVFTRKSTKNRAAEG